MHTVFEVKNDPEILTLASKVVTHLTGAGGAMTSDEVEWQVKNALEWLHGERTEYQRLAAVLILKKMGEPQDMEDPVVIQTFDPNSGDYYACWNCRTPIALHQHVLPDQPGMQMDDRTFSEAINVRTNGPAEDYVFLDCTKTNVYGIACNLGLATKFLKWLRILLPYSMCMCLSLWRPYEYDGGIRH